MPSIVEFTYKNLKYRLVDNKVEFFGLLSKRWWGLGHIDSLRRASAEFCNVIDKAIKKDRHAVDVF